MNLLVVRAHPLDPSKSRTMAMVEAFLDGFRETHPQAAITDLHLYDMEVPEIGVNLLTAWESTREGVDAGLLTDAQQHEMKLFDHFTQQFLDADVVVVANPLWNLSVTTRLKAWIDTVCRSGVTFYYTSDGKAHGMAHGKRSIHIQSSGGYFEGKDPASTYVRTIFQFLGCTHSQLRAEGMDNDPDRADEIMEAAFAECREAGRAI